MQRIFRSRVVLISALFLALLVVIAIIGPLIYTVDPATGDVEQLRAFPTLSHPLGTDDSGRDTLARLMTGLRVSLAVAQPNADSTRIAPCRGAVYGLVKDASRVGNYCAVLHYMHVHLHELRLIVVVALPGPRVEPTRMHPRLSM